MCCAGTLVAQTGATGQTGPAVPYSEASEAGVLRWSTTLPPVTNAQQDTSSSVLAYIGPFQNGYRCIRRDGRMGLLNADLTVRIPFIYTDIQAVTTGLNPTSDYVLIARRSTHGRYGTIDANGAPTSEFVLSYNGRLKIYRDCIIDSPQPNQFFIRHRDGRPSSNTAYRAVWTHPVLLANGHRVLSVQRSGSEQLALFNMDTNNEVTQFAYSRLSRVEPVVAPRKYLPLLEGYTAGGIVLLRPDGGRLTAIKFAGVEDYNNWKQLRTYFGLPDDPDAEAIGWTADADVYIIYKDDRVAFLGRYETY